MGTFSSLTTAASGMNAAKAALEVISNNIANANTPGYKRQQVVLIEGNPPTGSMPQGSVSNMISGTGVQVAGIRIIQDEFLDNRIADAAESHAEWTAAKDLLESVQSLLGEPGENGVSALLDDFWNTWRELGANPTSLSARTTVVSTANALAGRIKEIFGNVTALQKTMNDTVINRVDEINRIAGDIAEVNQKVVQLESGGYAPNDLLNRRDKLVEDLSKIVSVDTFGNTGADFMLNLGGITLVEGTLVRDLNTETDANGMVHPYWDSDIGRAIIKSGELKGVLQARDYYIPDYINKLNTMVGTLVNQVNSVHSTGYDMSGKITGTNFFAAGSEAGSLALDAAILNDPSLVASAATDAPSDSSIAQAIADLSETKLIGNESVSQYYRSFISKVGGDVGIADRSATTREFTMQQLSKQRDSLSGVSLDDEMIDMVKFQQAFAASARVFEATNYILQTLFEAA